MDHLLKLFILVGMSIAVKGQETGQDLNGTCCIDKFVERIGHNMGKEDAMNETLHQITKQYTELFRLSSLMEQLIEQNLQKKKTEAEITRLNDKISLLGCGQKVLVTKQFIQVYDRDLQSILTFYHGMDETLAGAEATCASIGHHLACTADPAPILELINNLSLVYPEIDTKSRIGGTMYNVYRLGGRVSSASAAACFDGTRLTNLPWGGGAPHGDVGGGLSIWKPSGTNSYVLDDVSDGYVIHFICQYP